MPFQPGQSGNPLGPNIHKPWRDAINRALARRASGEGHPQALERLASKLLDACETGDLGALKELGDRQDGKPAQQQIHTGDEAGGPVKVLFGWQTTAEESTE